MSSQKRDIKQGVASQANVARFLYERGREQFKTGVPWESLRPSERDKLVDLVAPVVPVLERLVEAIKEEVIG